MQNFYASLRFTRKMKGPLYINIHVLSNNIPTFELPTLGKIMGKFRENIVFYQNFPFFLMIFPSVENPADGAFGPRNVELFSIYILK